MGGLNRVWPALAGANADCLFDIRDEDLPVADLVSSRRPHDGFDRAVQQPIFQHNFNFYFGQEIDDILGAAIKLGVALLSAETSDLDDRQPGDADFVKSAFNLIELERLDDGFDLLHARHSPIETVARFCAFVARTMPR